MVRTDAKCVSLLSYTFASVPTLHMLYGLTESLCMWDGSDTVTSEKLLCSKFIFIRIIGEFDGRYWRQNGGGDSVVGNV